MILTLLILQAAAPAPDIELNVGARIKSVRIEQKGEARLEVHGDGPGTRFDQSVEPRAEGRSELRNVRVNIHAQASVADPAQIKIEAETDAPH